MLQTDKNPEIKEAVWRASVKKSQAQDKFRFERRLKVLGVAVLFLMVGALLWRFTG